MKTHIHPWLVAAWLCAAPSPAQQPPGSTPPPAVAPVLPAGTHLPGDYSADLATVRDAQDQALAQARQLLEQNDDLNARAPLEAAVTEMERSRKMLEAAGRSPEKLPAALAAQQAAYQALLKLIPREYRVSKSQNGSQAGAAGQPNPRELDQLDLSREENRYETERQAAAAPNRQQREQSAVADRLKQLAQRQQDLNDRLRELQTALQQARSEPEREEVQRQLKRLRDEERQMLASMDELRQRLAQSPDAAPQPDARQQLDQTRSDMQRAAQELERDAVSQALAAGARAQQGLQNARENLRHQASSQFAEQLRQLRNQARELERQEDDIARALESLNNPGHKSLDDSTQRRQLNAQMSRQLGALTHLLTAIRNVTEQAESTEPLLAQQLYGTLRRTELMHVENQLATSAQLVDRGFLPQAGEAESSARQNINQLRQDLERAAESILGNESDTLRFAQRELDDLERQVEREIATNPPAAVPSETAGQSRSNSVNPLRQLAQQLGGGREDASEGPIAGDGYVNWSDRLRDVEQVLDPPDVRNQLATVRERLGAFRGYYRGSGRIPETETVRSQILTPMTQVRVWVREELARRESAESLVPLDRDPVPENYSELVRKYYEKLGSAQ